MRVSSIGVVDEYMSRPASGMPTLRTAVSPRPHESRTSVIWNVPSGVTCSLVPDPVVTAAVRCSGSSDGGVSIIPCTNWKCTGSLLFSCMSCTCACIVELERARLGPVGVADLGHHRGSPSRAACASAWCQTKTMPFFSCTSHERSARRGRDLLAVGDVHAAPVGRRTASRGTGSASSRPSRGRRRRGARRGADRRRRARAPARSACGTAPGPGRSSGCAARRRPRGRGSTPPRTSRSGSEA